MKKTIKLLLAGTVAAFCCSMGKADTIIYSNNFALGTGVNISNTAPTVANTFAGGISNAHWLDVEGTNNTHGPLLDNGIDNCTAVDYWALPFTPQSNHVYLLTVNMTFAGNPGVAPEFGFHTLYTTNYLAPPGDARFNGSLSGYDWMGPLYTTGNPEHFAGAKTANAIFNASGGFPAATPATHTFQMLLDTRGVLSASGTNWCAAGYVNGIQEGILFTYGGTTPNPTNILSVGISQNGSPSTPTNIEYNTFALTTTLQPFIVQQPAPQVTVGGGSQYTNIVTVMADTNGGPLSYQWYANNLPLTNGVNNVVSANSNILVVSPVGTVNLLSNYFVIVANNFGSSTSALASLTVLTNIAITAPTSLSNSITLFTAGVGTVGSSPTFSVTAIGAPPLTYQWLTNGVAVAGATTSSLSFTNLLPGAPTSYTCTVSNSFGPTNVNWFASYVTAPTSAYPQAVLGDFPLELWRLNEADDGSGNTGEVAHDYASGNNGVYNNLTLGQTGYNPLEPSETSMFVVQTGNPSSVNTIGNLDLAATMTNGVNAQFSVEAWADCQAANGTVGGAPVIAQGNFGQASFFLGVDTNAVTKHYQFYVRNAAGTLSSADDTVVSAQDVQWHHLVGVCDEAHTNVSLYVDGRLAASASIAANSGNFESGYQMAIGAGMRANFTPTNVPFTGNIDDVAIYKRALSIGQVINHYGLAGGTVAVSVVPPLPVTNLPYLANETLTIPATIAGSGPLSYYWTNLTAGGAALSSGGTTNPGTLDATLTIPNASAGLNGNQLQLVVFNPSSSATGPVVTLTNVPAPVALAYTNPILYSNVFNGGTWVLNGRALTAANVLVGGTNSMWVDSLGTNDTGGSVQASGIPATIQADSWLLPFTPHSGYVYNLSASMTFSGNPGNWVGLGFTQIIPTNATNGRFADTPNNAYDWQILTESSGNVQYFAGTNGNGTVVSANSYFSNNIGTHTEQIVLDTTGAQWKYFSVVDGKISATNVYGSGVPTGASSVNPPIGAVGISQNALTAGAQGFMKWNSFTLTQTAPGGVPPYLLNPLPLTNDIVLSNGTVTISATAFGSGPLGYYWTNNATVVASGSTNIMAPLPANLSVSSSSLSAGPLQLVVTNAFGTNITTISLVNPTNTVNPNPGPILYSVTGGQLTLSWPTNLGWTLQTQTNHAPTAGITTNWVIVSNSTTTNQVVVPINTTPGSVFYRLSLP